MENQTMESQQFTEQPKKDRKALAIAGFIIGCCGSFTWLFSFVGVVISVVGIILSALGIKSSKKTFAIIGLVVSALALIATIIYTVVITTAVLGGLSSAGLLS